MDKKSSSGVTTDTSHAIPIKDDKSASASSGVGQSDGTHPKQPLDGSPVKTELDQHGKPMSGQAGAVPQTVAQHNADVDEASAKLEHNK